MGTLPPVNLGAGSSKFPVFISCHSSGVMQLPLTLLCSCQSPQKLVELWYIVTLLCCGFSIWDKQTFGFHLHRGEKSHNTEQRVATETFSQPDALKKKTFFL